MTFYCPGKTIIIHRTTCILFPSQRSNHPFQLRIFYFINKTPHLQKKISAVLTLGNNTIKLLLEYFPKNPGIKMVNCH